MFPSLTTQRFLLREIIAEDQPAIFEGLSHPDVIQYYGVHYKTLEETKAQMDFYKDLIKNETGIWWAVCFKDDPDTLLGACGFNYRVKEHKKTEIGYWLLPKYWGQGIMTEVIPVIIAYAFSKMDIHRIEAVIEEPNSDSSKLLKKFNFNYEGTLRDAELKNGIFLNLQYWALLSPA